MENYLILPKNCSTFLKKSDESINVVSKKEEGDEAEITKSDNKQPTMYK